MPITPNADQFAELVADSETNTGEVVMLNLLEYKARATDGEGVLLAMTPRDQVGS